MTMADQRGNYCDVHDPRPGWFRRLLGARPSLTHRCFCDEDHDRAAGIHRASGLDDGMGGYLCVCLGGRYSVKYGCIATGLGKEH